MGRLIISGPHEPQELIQMTNTSISSSIKRVKTRRTSVITLWLRIFTECLQNSTWDLVVCNTSCYIAITTEYNKVKLYSYQESRFLTDCVCTCRLSPRSHVSTSVQSI